MRASALARLANISRLIDQAKQINAQAVPRQEPPLLVRPSTWLTAELVRNRAERRARVDTPDLVPPELARRPPLTDGDD